GAADLSPTPIQNDRELQRTVQRDLRRPRAGADEGREEHRPLRAGRCVRLPVDAALSVRAPPGPTGRAQTLSQGCLTNYDRASPKLQARVATMAPAWPSREFASSA